MGQGERRVAAEVEGPLDENHYVIDFLALRDAVRSIVVELDHHMLLPTGHPTIQVQGPYSGSALSTGKLPFTGKLSLQEAVARAVDFNLGAIGLTQVVRQSRGQARVARSALLPNLNANLSETAQQTNLRALGLRVTVPIQGFSFPTVVGPFNFFD